MADLSYQKDDGIDLYELITILWSHKFLIGAITGVFICVSIYIVLTFEKKYIATAKFEIEKTSSSALNLNGEFGTLASLAGFGGTSNSGTKILLERIMEREFILEARDRLSLIRTHFSNP